MIKAIEPYLVGFCANVNIHALSDLIACERHFAFSNVVR